MAKQTSQPCPPHDLAPSGATWAELKAGGLTGMVAAVCAANGFGHDLSELARRTIATATPAKLADACLDNFTSGQPVCHATTLAMLRAHARALAAVAQAVAESADLIESTPGVVEHQHDRVFGTFGRPHRSFP